MGTEYYILKPRTKEMFHLGKDLWYNLEGISQREPNFPEWQEYEDTACDIIRAHCYVSDDNNFNSEERKLKMWDWLDEISVTFTEDMNPKGIWEDAGQPVTAKHEKFEL